MRQSGSEYRIDNKERGFVQRPRSMFRKICTAFDMSYCCLRGDIMNPSLKELIDVASHLVKKGGEQLGIENLDQGFRYELLSFMMYLSASDGKIDASEAKVIEYYTGISASPQAIREHVRKNNINSAEYKNTVPHIFQAMIKADNELYKKKIHVEKYTGEIMIEAYIGIANELINADRSVSEIERTNVDVYINSLKKYLNDNLLAPRRE